MEKILAWIGIVIVYMLIQFVWRLLVTGTKAAAQTARGEGSFKENFSSSFNGGFGELQMRLVDEEVEGSNSKKFSVKRIQIKGMFPVSQIKRAAIVVSILDTTEETTFPVVSILEDYQESNSSAYQAIIDMGQMNPGYGFQNWTNVGGVMPDLLETAYRGKRKLSVVLRIVDLENPPAINLGFHVDDEGLIWAGMSSFDYDIIFTGYKEEVENRIIAHCSIIKLGVYAAMSDGNFDDEEGSAIKKWMHHSLLLYSESRYEETKKKFNEAFKSAYIEHNEGTLSLSQLCGVLNEIDIDSLKYEAIELCYDVVAADKKIEREEAEMVKTITEALNLDYEEISKIKDRKLIGLDTTAQNSSSIEQLLGINDAMTEDEINSHLRKEFQKWNSRLNTLPEGEERENAQRMLDFISEFRNDRAA